MNQMEVYLAVSFSNIKSYSIVQDASNKLKNQKKANVFNKVDGSWKKGDIVCRGSKKSCLKYCQVTLDDFFYLDMEEDETDLEHVDEQPITQTKSKSK